MNKWMASNSLRGQSRHYHNLKAPRAFGSPTANLISVSGQRNYFCKLWTSPDVICIAEGSKIIFAFFSNPNAHQAMYLTQVQHKIYLRGLRRLLTSLCSPFAIAPVLAAAAITEDGARIFSFSLLVPLEPGPLLPFFVFLFFAFHAW